MEFKTLIEIDPVAKQRPRYAKNGIFYTPKETKTFEKEIKEHCKKFLNLNRLRCLLNAIFILCSKKSQTVKRHHHTVRPDIDNLLKSVLDGMNGIIYEDDCQIVILNAIKKYIDEGESRIYIEIQDLEDGS
jgi:Holliday junction resolvase